MSFIIFNVIDNTIDLAAYVNKEVYRNISAYHMNGNKLIFALSSLVWQDKFG